MRYSIGIVISIFLFLVNIPNAFAEDTLQIDTKLKHSPDNIDNYYTFPKQTQLILSGNHEMCPSNNCKIIFDKYVDEFIGSGVVLTTEPNKNKMTLNGYFRLTGGEDDKCICIIGLLFECETHTETNEKLGTTKYVCGGSGSFIPEDESKGAYNYDYTASFELPSKHFIFNGTSTGTTGGSQHDCILFDC